MISPELRALIQQLELTTKKMVSGPLLGDWKSSLKGSGFEFQQLRDYDQSDDIRFIDWKASARANKMLVRQYLDDRTKVVNIVVDVSASTYFSRKADLIRQIASFLAFLGLHSKDGVGLVLFSSEVEHVIKPKQSRAHVWSLVEQLYTYKPQHKETEFGVAFDYLARMKRSVVCLITDCLAPIDKKKLQMVARRHDLRVFRCLDQREKIFPVVDSLRLEDRETGKHLEYGGKVNQRLAEWHGQQRELISGSKVPLLDVTVDEPFTGDLVRFLRQRIGE